MANSVTWIDEQGYERGVCLCGCEASMQPDHTSGGLSFCIDCGQNTCASCRDGHERCANCLAEREEREIEAIREGES